MNRTLLYIIFLLISVCIAPINAIAQKTDTIVHVNGNVLTGDLKKLVYGVFTWKMDGMGTISMEEVKVNTIISRKQFEIKMDDGQIFFGSFDSSGVDRKVNIVLADGKKMVDVEDIVEIYPIKRNFWMRTSGNFSFGYNYSKGSDIGTLALSGNLSYRKKTSNFDFSFDDNNTYQADTLNATKTDVLFAWQRVLKKKWSTEVAVGGNQNTELGTKLRLNLSVIGLKDISYNHWNRLYAGAGLSVNRETPFDDSGETNDLAGIFQMVWKVYKYSIPKVWVDSNISFVPYITDGGRYRTVFNLNPQVSILSDNFKVGISFYATHDTKPTSSASSTSDFGTNIQLTYSFH